MEWSWPNIGASGATLTIFKPYSHNLVNLKFLLARFAEVRMTFKVDIRMFLPVVYTCYLSKAEGMLSMSKGLRS